MCVRHAVDLIERIYLALVEDAALEVAPSAIAEAAEGRSATGMDQGPNSQVEELKSCYFSDGMNQFYRNNRMDRHDESMVAANRCTERINKAIRIGDFHLREDYERSFLFQEFIRAFDNDSSFYLGFKVPLEEGAIVTIGVHKGRSSTDYSDEELAKFAGLGRHVARMASLRRRAALRAESSAAAMMGINSLEDGYMLVDPDRTIVFANAKAQSLLSGGDLLRDRTGKLLLKRPQDDKKLGRALQDADRRVVSGKLAFAARDASGGFWRFTLAPQLKDGRTAILIWLNRSQVGVSASKFMQQIYGISDAELPVMLAIVEGKTAAQISQELHISVATVRSHIQHIYLKTGIAKATQLAALVATLPKI